MKKIDHTKLSFFREMSSGLSGDTEVSFCIKIPGCDIRVPLEFSGIEGTMSLGCKDALMIEVSFLGEGVPLENLSTSLARDTNTEPSQLTTP